MAARQKTCMVCGLSDGHTLMDCPYKCEFCGESVNNCECRNSSIVSSVLASETPEKEGKKTATSKPAYEKRKASDDDCSSVAINKSGQKRPKTVPEKKFKDVTNELGAVLEQMRQSEQLNRKREEEYRATISALQRRIEELEESATKDTDDGPDNASDTGDDNDEEEIKDDDDDDEGAECSQIKTNVSELITGSNLEGIHSRYKGVLRILQKRHCSLTEAMRRYGIARNTLRDYIGLCELKIVDHKRYERVVEAEHEKTGKVSAKTIERRCRVTLKELKARVNQLKQEKQLLPFYPNEEFYSEN